MNEREKIQITISRYSPTKIYIIYSNFFSSSLVWFDNCISLEREKDGAFLQEFCVPPFSLEI